MWWLEAVLSLLLKDNIGEWWSFLNNEVHLTSNTSNLQRENEKVPVWVIVWKCGNLYCKKRKDRTKILNHQDLSEKKPSLNLQTHVQQ